MYEGALNNELSLSNVQMLTNLYQKAIEYYSAFDNMMFNDFLNRMQSLLSREDIQIVLNSFGDQNTKGKIGNAQGKGKKSENVPKKPEIDFNVDEEDNAVEQQQRQ